MNADILAVADEEFKRTAGGRIPMARFGHPEDLKGPVIFLCSEASNYVTGETLTVCCPELITTKPRV
jgi:2-deoxy-D-gluconate 3-dehydrogenase